MKYRQFFGGLMASALMLTALTGCWAKPASTSDSAITIYHTNDLHGRVISTLDDEGQMTQIGLDTLKTAKESTPNALLIDAGDATQGVAVATYSEGANIIQMMNAAGYDGMALGNHEFDYGVEALLQNASSATFPIVSANAQRDGKPLLEGVRDGNGSWFVKEVAGRKIGFFGLTTVETAYKANPKKLEGVVFADELETARAMVALLREEQKADAVVCIAHLGTSDSTQVTSHVLAEQVEGIDVILDGHSHTTETTQVGSTTIQQTGTGGKNLGEVKLSFDKKGALTVEARLLSAQEVGQLWQPDAGVVNFYDRMMEGLAPTLNQVLGVSNTSLYGGTYEGVNICRVGETNLGDLVADAMVSAGRELVAGTDHESLPVVALQNGGSIRTTVPAGEVTVGHISDVLPFGNALAIKAVTPDVLYEALENGVAQAVDAGNGAFPQVSGMRFTYETAGTPRNQKDPASQPGSRVMEVALLDETGGDKLVLDRADTATQILLVSNDFEVAGGDRYDMLAGLPTVAEGSTLDVAVQDHIRALCEKTGSFTYRQQGRITLKQEVAPRYTAAIKLMKDGAPLASASVSVLVDGTLSTRTTTDADGVLTLQGLAPNMGHEITVTSGELRADGYVSDLADLTQLTLALNQSKAQVVVGPAGNPGTGNNLVIGVSIALLLSAGTAVALRRKKQ